ncbi:hypothetical protein BG006_009800 [Podila minutissima]|uniref:BTB domain-containing protein n=1 Tax=Podila minutissima TaxID=64525 RepID=A0A9P5SE30_9FUNG|nr:hypothetical protein BG006_009800 [Podila minutissima]
MNKSKATYLSNKSTGQHTLTIRIQWDPEKDDSENYTAFESKLGNFGLSLKKNLGRYDFLVRAEGDNRFGLSLYKSCSGRLQNGKCLFFGAIALQTSSILQYVMTIPITHLETEDRLYRLVINLSSQEVSLPTSPPNSVHPTPPPKNVQLEKIFTDCTYHDVFFVFDDPLTLSSTEPGTPTTSAVGAHKLVLSQWPYFQMTFKSGFSEGGPGEKRIQVKETKAATFKLLLRYLYTESLPQGAQPKTAYTDVLMSAEEVSWEDLYLVADRYEIDGLRQSALGHLLPGSSSESVISFLFRTAYLFKELREPVVKYVARTCGAEISKKAVQQEYADHPERAELFGEIITEIFSKEK